MGVYTQPYRSDELYHFGIKGMHWGIRRYQNPDGTLTSAGRKHYEKIASNKRVANTKGDIIGIGLASAAGQVATSAIASKKILGRNMTKSELKDAVTRGAIIGVGTAAAQAIAYAGKQRAKAILAKDNELKGIKEQPTDEKQKIQFTKNQKKAIKIGLTAVGIGLAAYGAYKIGSQLSDENGKWHNTRKLVNNYTGALAKEREANRVYNSRLADKNSSVESLVRADRRRFEAADKRFDASARMTEYSQTKLTEKPNIFQQHANKQRTLDSSGRTSSGHSKDAEEMLRSFAENERDKERIKSQTASTRDAFRKATSKPTSLETIRKSASTGEHNVPAIKLEFGSGGNNSTGSDYAKKILEANNATSKSLGQVKTNYSDMDDYVQELLRRSRR